MHRILFYFIIKLNILFSSSLKSDKFCITKYNMNDYIGHANTTREGSTCVRWVDIMKDFLFSDYDYPEKSVIKAKNYCRNPYNLAKFPYCYTHIAASTYKMELCDVPMCTSVQEMGYPTQSSTFDSSTAKSALLSRWSDMSCSSTNIEHNPYWRMDFSTIIHLTHLEFILDKKHFDNIIVLIRTPDRKLVNCSKYIENESKKIYECYMKTDQITIKLNRNQANLKICNFQALAAFNVISCDNEYFKQGYNGKVSMTLSRQICESWSSFQNLISKANFLNNQYPDNYCRPLLDPHGAWCFVNVGSYIYEKQYCLMEKCTEYEFDCKLTSKGTNYRGYLNVASNQESCHFWSLLTDIYPNIRKFGTEQQIKNSENYCRNFNDDINGPWCYTTGYGHPKIYCNVPFCLLVSSFSRCFPKGCEIGVDNEISCGSFITFLVNKMWIQLNFTYPINVVVVKIHGIKLQYFTVDTSNDGYQWSTCAQFYQSLNSNDKIVLKCTAYALKIRLRSIIDYPTSRICEFQVFTKKPHKKTCMNDGSKSLSYSGTHAVDIYGHRCEYWIEAIRVSKLRLLDVNFISSNIIKERNYCRTPIFVNKPWCFVNVTQRYIWSRCEPSLNCVSSWLPKTCGNTCYTITMGYFPSCQVLQLKDLNMKSSYSRGLTQTFIMPQAKKMKSYLIMVLSKHFLNKPQVDSITMIDDLSIEYFADEIKGSELRLGIYPLRKVELKEWMSYLKKNPKTDGYLYLLVMALMYSEGTSNNVCSDLQAFSTIKLAVLNTLDFLEVVATNTYYIKL